MIGHVTKPQLHFLMIAGIVDPPGGGPAQVLLADPSWGRRIVPLEALVTEKGFSGVILLAVPKTKTQLKEAKALQAKELAWAKAEPSRLAAYGQAVNTGSSNPGGEDGGGVGITCLSSAGLEREQRPLRRHLRQQHLHGHGE
ncbi:hypothetical protein [Marinithermus hydrothermalis]|uniref:hypothetical protein n=1 Tax=Marinithermus hydrothermalis TaxID=186192 RepID=UPI0002ED2B2C|nr:hypothetical protein [Marinithermus hydrothermalis]